MYFKIVWSFLRDFITLIHSIEFPKEFISVILLLVFITLSYILARKFSKRSIKSQSILSDFSIKIKVTSNKVELPEYTTIAKGTVIYTKTISPIGVAYSSVKWQGRETVSATDISLRDLCAQPPLIIKLDSTIGILMPAVKILEGAYKDVIISCLNTEDLRVDKWLEVVYGEGFARSSLSIEDGRIKARLEWVRYIAELTTRRVRVKAQVEVCYGKEPCVPLIETSKPGITEKIVNYPVVKRVFIGYKSGSGFEGLEELLKEFPSVFGVENVNVRLRVQRSLRVVAESSTPLSNVLAHG